MEIIDIVTDAQPAVVVVLIIWNVSLQKELQSMRDRLDRVYDRAERTRDSLIAKVTKTDVGES